MGGLRPLKRVQSAPKCIIRKPKRTKRRKVNKFRRGSTNWKPRPDLIAYYQALEDAGRYSEKSS